MSFWFGYGRRCGAIAAALALGAALVGAGVAGAAAPTLIEPPMLAPEVAAGTLPPVAERLPEAPAVADFARDGKTIGRHGGDLTVLMGRAKDTRVLYVYAYARLVGFTPTLKIAPDLLAAVEVEDDRIFTLRLRPGHRWSDGHPFTSDDFRYWWEARATNPALSPFGPPAEYLVDGAQPTVTFPDATTVRFEWPRANPYFLPYLASARPYGPYLPAHYLRRFHGDYADPEALARRVAEARQDSWAQLHNRLDNLNRYDNPDIPVLQPWVVTTRAPADRFVFVRNPYYHRVDPEGRQLPYLDRILMVNADRKIVPAKTGAGESDLQARYLRFDNYTFLKQAEAGNGIRVLLWRTGQGARVALYPNLNANDPVWRGLNRDVRFRRALSLGIDRDEINQVIFYGLAMPLNNLLTADSPLFDPALATAWTRYDVAEANRLLDAAGLSPPAGDGLRRLPDGRPAELILEVAGQTTEEVDITQLIADSWRKLGLKLYVKQVQLEVLRNRIYAGETVLSMAPGVDNGIATADMSPGEFVPIDQNKYQWPKWGQYHQTHGEAGEPVDLAPAAQLLTALTRWQDARNRAGRAAAWREILEISADQQFTIGIVNGVPQPVVVRRSLRNVPEVGLYNYEPGAHFGLYRPDTFWFAE